MKPGQMTKEESTATTCRSGAAPCKTEVTAAKATPRDGVEQGCAGEREATAAVSSACGELRCIVT